MARREKRHELPEDPPRATRSGRLVTRQPGPGAGTLYEELQVYGTWERCGGGWRRSPRVGSRS